MAPNTQTVTDAERLFQANEAAVNFYQLMLMRGRSEGSANARAYLSSRGINSDICRRWRIGFSTGHSTLSDELGRQGFTEDELVDTDLSVAHKGMLLDRFYNRVMFPIADQDGRVVAFGGRVMGDAKPKYLNTRETAIFHKSKGLYGIDRAKATISESATALLVEGYTDVIALHEAGYTNAVAALGTALSLDHLNQLESHGCRRAICMFDGDAAGQKAAELACQHDGLTDIELLCVILPEHKDPAEFIAAYGAEALSDQLRRARPLTDFVFDRILDRYDLHMVGQRVAAFKEAVALAAHVHDDVRREAYVAYLSNRFNMSTANIYDEMKKVQQRQPKQAAKEPVRPCDRREEASRAVEEALVLAALRHPEAVREHWHRIAALTWLDERNETIVWGVLSTPVGSSLETVHATVARLVPGLDDLFATYVPISTGDMGVDEQVRFLVDVAELHSCRRQIAGLRLGVASDALKTAGDEARQMFLRVVDLQQRCNELVGRVSGVESQGADKSLESPQLQRRPSTPTPTREASAVPTR